MTQTATKPHVVTRRIGGLSGIHHEGVETVTWSRKLPLGISRELVDLKPEHDEFAFVTLATDPYDRVRQQLKVAGLPFHYLTYDIALLTTVFGEISKARRIRVVLDFSGRMKNGDTVANGAPRLSGSYYASDRPHRSVGRVAVFRGEAGQHAVDNRRAPSLQIHLEHVPDGKRHRMAAR